MEKPDFEKYHFLRKPNGDYLLICDDCGEHKEVEEDMEDFMNEMLHKYQAFVEIATIADEIAPILQNLLPMNKSSSKDYSRRITQLYELIKSIKHLM